MARDLGEIEGYDWIPLEHVKGLALAHEVADLLDPVPKRTL